MSASLAAWMNGEFVGTWTVDRGAHRFTYQRDWLESPKRRVLSLSLPITPTLEVGGDVVKNYFENLLPDNEKIRERVARRHKTQSTGAFELLEAIGRDCVGAVQLLPEGMEPQGWDSVEGQPLNEAQVAGILRGVTLDGMPGQEREDPHFRISLAGAQEKTALLRRRGQWYLPRGATPTTHIIKLPLGLVGGVNRVDLRDSVANEWLCASILHHLGLPVAPTEMWRFEDQQVLVVTRFDRSWQRRQGGGEWIARLPQEDFCQALGYPPGKKYEIDKGPGIGKCMDLLEKSQDEGDRGSFAVTQLTFWLMAATDGHAKNYSIFLQPGDAFITTPLYDVLSMFPYIGKGANQRPWEKERLALALRSSNQPHDKLKEIQARHWRDLAMQFGGPSLWARMLRHVERVGSALEDVERDLPKDFPEPTWLSISEGIRRQAARFRAGLVGLR